MKVQFSVLNYQKNMVVKSIFTVSCFVVMALAIGTEDWKMPPPILINLIEEMNATCFNLMVNIIYLF